MKDIFNRTFQYILHDFGQTNTDKVIWNAIMFSVFVATPVTFVYKEFVNYKINNLLEQVIKNDQLYMEEFYQKKLKKVTRYVIGLIKIIICFFELAYLFNFENK